MSYKLRARDLEFAKTEASMFAERTTGYKSWFPVETIPATDKYYWYTLNRMVQPEISMDGGSYAGVRTARTEDSAPIVWMRYGFTWSYTEIEAAQRNGVPLKADDIRVALHQMRLKIGQLILEGLDVPDVINGLTEDGVDQGALPAGAPLDGILWGSADQAIIHAATAYKAMMDAGHMGPYNWVVGSTLMPYLGYPLSSSGEPQGKFIERAFGCTIYPETCIATASFDASWDAETIYQFRYMADDGIWVFFDPNPANMALAQFWEPRAVVDPIYDREHNCFRGYVEWAGTLRVTHTNAIAYMEDVDLA